MEFEALREMKQDFAERSTADSALTASVQSTERPEVFVVYQARREAADWVEQTLMPGVRRYLCDFIVAFLQQELTVPGRHRTELVVSKLRTTDKVLLVLSHRFNDCKYCRYALQTLVPEHLAKVVVVTLGDCQPPTLFQNTPCLQHDDPNFWHQLHSRLRQSPPTSTGIHDIFERVPYFCYAHMYTYDYL